jgi:methionyl aminopeptidase
VCAIRCRRTPRARGRRMRREAVRAKSSHEIERMRQAGRIVARVLAEMGRMVRPGVTTTELDEVAEALIRSLDGLPSFKGYHGYPASICASVNEEVVHGIPGGRPLREGDIVSVDVGAIYAGYHGDAARTFAVGEVDEPVRLLLAATRLGLERGIAAARAGNALGDVSHAIEQAAREMGVEVVRAYGGHGIGTQMHEPPQINNWGPAGRGPVLRPGMTFALEPMFTLGGHATRVLADGWTVVTVDGSWAAHEEHTVAVTEQGGEMLTMDDGSAVAGP